MDDGLFKGLNQTSRARIETLKKIVKAFHGQCARSPGLVEMQQAVAGGLAWKLWAKARKSTHSQASR